MYHDICYILYNVFAIYYRDCFLLLNRDVDYNSPDPPHSYMKTPIYDMRYTILIMVQPGSGHI